VVRSLAGLGTVLGARVLGELGDEPNRYDTAKSREKLCRHVTHHPRLGHQTARARPPRPQPPPRRRHLPVGLRHPHRLTRALSTPTGPPATPTTPPSEPSTTASSASRTAASNTTPATTRTPPGPTAPNRNPPKPLDIYSRGMSSPSVRTRCCSPRRPWPVGLWLGRLRSCPRGGGQGRSRPAPMGSPAMSAPRCGAFAVWPLAPGRCRFSGGLPPAHHSCRGGSVPRSNRSPGAADRGGGAAPIPGTPGDSLVAVTEESGGPTHLHRPGGPSSCHPS
jgi:hypothetical protein